MSVIFSELSDMHKCTYSVFICFFCFLILRVCFGILEAQLEFFCVFNVVNNYFRHSYALSAESLGFVFVVAYYLHLVVFAVNKNFIYCVLFCCKK